MSNERVGYFGFGSLVNRNTLRTNYIDTFPATLRGWRRHWQRSLAEPSRDIALLSIHRHQACELKGMLVVDHASNLAAVDEREIGYDRVELSPDDLVFSDDTNVPERLFVYVAQEQSDERLHGNLLQSYLDAVLQGFHLEYGEEGIQHFFSTTIGFNRTMKMDRDFPEYPRSVTLDEVQRTLIDDALSRAMNNHL